MRVCIQVQTPIANDGSHKLTGEIGDKVKSAVALFPNLNTTEAN